MSDTTKKTTRPMLATSPVAAMAALTLAAGATYEPRTPTSEPLVEINEAGRYVPAGRRIAPTGRVDGRNGFGLTEQENVAFWAGVARLNTNKPDTEVIDGVTSSVHKNPYEFITVHEAKFAEGLIGDALAEAVELWRKDYPLPERFSALDSGDPSSNVQLTADEQAAIDKARAEAAPSSSESTLNAPVSVRSEAIPAANIPHDIADIDTTRQPASSGVVRTITKSSAKPMTRAEMIEAGLIDVEKPSNAPSDRDLVTSGASAAVRETRDEPRAEPPSAPRPSTLDVG